MLIKVNVLIYWHAVLLGLPRWPSGKTPLANAGDARDMGSTPGSGRSPGEGNSNLLQYSCWKIPWAKKPGGLQGVGHDWAHMHTHTHIQSNALAFHIRSDLIRLCYPKHIPIIKPISLVFTCVLAFINNKLFDSKDFFFIYSWTSATAWLM